MPITSRRTPAIDFKCGPKGVLRRGSQSVEVGPQVYVLAVYLVHKRGVSVRAVKLRLWGDAGAERPDNTVSQLGRRLNEKLAELGSEARVSIHDGRVELKRPVARPARTRSPDGRVGRE